MVRRILFANRRIVEYCTPHMFMMGTALVVVIGVSIILGRIPISDLSHIPKWLGYVWMWFGVILLISYCVELVFNFISLLRRLREKETLLEKIAMVENNQLNTKGDYGN